MVKLYNHFQEKSFSLFKSADNGQTRVQLQVLVLAPNFNSTSNRLQNNTARMTWQVILTPKSLTTNCYDSILKKKKTWELNEQVKWSTITIQNHKNNKITEENLLTNYLPHRQRTSGVQKKSPVSSRLWFRRVKLAHLCYASEASQAERKTDRSPNLISCSEFVLQLHSSLKFIWTQEKAELTENCFQIQAVLHLLSKTLS